MRVYTTPNGNAVHFNKGCAGAKEEMHICGKCGVDFIKQDRVFRLEQNHNEKEFIEYLKHPKQTPPHVVVRSGEELSFSEKATELIDFDFNHVKVYISGDGTMIGIKPVSGGDVDTQSLSAKGKKIAFGGIATELNVDFSVGHERYEVEWDSGDRMFIVDFIGKQV
jgi:hypothetical protein